MSNLASRCALIWGSAHTALAIMLTLFWEVLFSSFLQSRMHLQSQPDAEQPVSSEKQQAYTRMQVIVPVRLPLYKYIT